MLDWHKQNDYSTLFVHMCSIYRWHQEGGSLVKIQSTQVTWLAKLTWLWPHPLCSGTTHPASLWPTTPEVHWQCWAGISVEDKVERIVYSHMLGLIVEYCVCDGYYTSVISQGGKTNHRESSGGHKLCVLACVWVGKCLPKRNPVY